MLKWLPADTETLVVAQSFEISKPEPMDLDVPKDLKPMIQSLALEELMGLGAGDRDLKYLEPLFGKKVRIALTGGRNFEIVSSFGSMRSENCSIIIFEKELGQAGKEWTERVRQDAMAVRQLVGREVFVFPSTTVMEGWHKLEPWQGACFVMLKPDTLLCASSDRYLEELLKRIDKTPMRRALPDSLPEWRHVDPTSAAWMLRHIPEGNPDRLISGATWTWKDDRLQVIYVSLAEKGELVEHSVRKRWNLTQRPRSELPLLEARAEKIERRDDGTVAVTIRTKDVGWEPTFWFSLQCYVLRGEDGGIGRP